MFGAQPPTLRKFSHTNPLDSNSEQSGDSFHIGYSAAKEVFQLYRGFRPSFTAAKNTLRASVVCQAHTLSSYVLSFLGAQSCDILSCRDRLE